MVRRVYSLSSHLSVKDGKQVTLSLMVRKNKPQSRDGTWEQGPLFSPPLSNVNVNTVHLSATSNPFVVVYAFAFFGFCFCLFLFVCLFLFFFLIITEAW